MLTPQSIERPWILYEAGVAKGKLGATVLGVALGAPLDTVSAGPFGQFQNCGDDEDSLTKLVMQLLARNPDAAPREEAVRMQVKIFRDKVRPILAKRGKATKAKAGAEDDKNIAKLFEKVKAMVRDLPERVEHQVNSSTTPRQLRDVRRLHPAMLEELMLHSRFTTEDGGAAGFLIAISMFREDLPWVYEAGMEVYRALRSGETRAVNEAREQFTRVLDATNHPMFFEFFGGGSPDRRFVLLEFTQMVQHFLDRPRRPQVRPTPVKADDAGPKIR